MKTKLTGSTAALIMLLLCASLPAQDLSSLNLIAHYPLSTTANDTTGTHGPMLLINTPFADGGIYCNGNYIGSDPDSCHAVTPELPGWNFSNFAVSAVFKVDSITDYRRPVLVFGRNWKWCSLFIDADSTIGLAQGGFFGTSQSSGVHYASRTWHTVTYTYNSVQDMGRLYFNGVQVDSSMTAFDPHDDRHVSITHGSVGRTFQGYLKDLKIYSWEAPLTDLQKDSLALVAVYNSTNGSSWNSNDNWLSGQLDSWHGVYTNGTRVVQLNLGNNNLDGPLPPEIGDLTQLGYVEMGSNQISGTLPVEMGNLVNLTFLDLFANQLTGPVPDGFGNMTELQWLVLASNQLDGNIPNAMGNLGKAEVLDLSSNLFTGPVPPEFSQLAQLQKLFLQQNMLESLPDLSGIASLNMLHVHTNRLTFGDLEPNAGIANFWYDPQEEIGTALDTTIASGDSITFTINTSGTANQYQWYKEHTAVSGATAASFSIDSAAVSDAGTYTCRVTNSIATNLTLVSRTFTLQVTAPTGVADERNELPSCFALHQNYPNPFNPETSIQFTLPESGRAVLEIINSSGEIIEVLADRRFEQGTHTAVWRKGNFASGIYFYRLRYKSFKDVKKMVLLK